VEVGSNVYRNTDGMIEIEGVPQIEVALKPITGALLVNFALFNEEGKVTAKLNDSTLMINEQRAYNVTRTPRVSCSHIRLPEPSSYRSMCPAPGVVALTKGEFHTMKGHVIRISPTEMEHR